MDSHASKLQDFDDGMTEAEAIRNHISNMQSEKGAKISDTKIVNLHANF